jgi:glycosyltransferase XagB
MRPQEALEAGHDAIARAADAACFVLFRAAPALSARRRLWLGQALVFILCAAGIGYAAWRFPLPTAVSAHAVGYAAFSALTLWRLFAAASALAPRAARGPGWSADLPVYTVLAALYREAHMMARIGDRPGRLDFPGILAQTPEALAPRYLITRLKSSM